MSENSNNWKHTLTLPQTEFPMRGNLPKREPDFLARWSELDIYQRWQTRADAPTFVLHDGPPYANGEIHIGHALNKVLKDIIVKYKSLRGFRVPYVPGWDCHGLPIETQVSKQLKKQIRDMDDASFRAACRDYADKYVDIQRDAFRRLGVFGDWDRPYRTMDYAYEAETLRRLAELVDKGFVFRRRKPVAWSLENRTALAEAELEYHDKKDTSVFVMFEVIVDKSTPDALLQDHEGDLSLMIWTTTPWTLPANLAVACHPDESYGIYDYQSDTGTHRVVVGEALAESIFSDAGIKQYTQKGTISGGKLQGLTYGHPFIERQGTVVTADFVTLEDGSGLVHIAPGHGADDYEIGLREGLDVYCPVLDNGCYDETVPEWLRGELVWDANSEIVAQLESSGHLFSQTTFKHSYPHDWRSKKPIIFRATWQWFIGIEHEHLRQQALTAIKDTEWTPAWGETRIQSMVEHRPDWCISRQRRWGVPIAVPFCTACGEPLLNGDVMRQVALRFETHGADAWFEDDVSAYLTADTACTNCEHTDFARGNDILDVWFDSGISWAAVCHRHEQLSVPADLYLEGSDQHRGWFQSSLLLGVALTGSAPFKGVLTHGFVVDGKGKKMSKSAGNVVDPAKIVKQYGAEILRLWIASEQYDDDIRISDEIIKGVVDAYRRIRNTFRFFVGNLSDFDPDHDLVSIEKMEPIDRWMLHQLTTFEHEILDAYDRYAFHLVYQKAVRFCAIDLSALYLDVAKDRLYCDVPNGIRRRSAQTVLYKLAESLAKLLSPILSFTSEELWQHLPEATTESVFLTTLEKPRGFALGDAESKSWLHLNQLRDEVLKKLEHARAEKVIGHSLDAQILIAGRGKLRSQVEDETAFLAEWLIVSQVEATGWEDKRLEATELEDLRVAVLPAQGGKCARCWQIQPEVDADNELCGRCQDVVKALDQESSA